MNTAFEVRYGMGTMWAVSRTFWRHFDSWGTTFISDEHQAIALCLVASMLDYKPHEIGGVS